MTKPEERKKNAAIIMNYDIKHDFSRARVKFSFILTETWTLGYSVCPYRNSPKSQRLAL